MKTYKLTSLHIDGKDFDLGGLAVVDEDGQAEVLPAYSGLFKHVYDMKLQVEKTNVAVQMTMRYSDGEQFLLKGLANPFTRKAFFYFEALSIFALTEIVGKEQDGSVVGYAGLFRGMAQSEDYAKQWINEKEDV